MGCPVNIEQPGPDLGKDQWDICPGPKLQGAHKKTYDPFIYLFIYKASVNLMGGVGLSLVLA